MERLLSGFAGLDIVDVWRKGFRYVYERTDSSRLIGVEIDGEQSLPDVRPENNRWFATKSR